MRRRGARPCAKGETVEIHGQSIELLDDIPAGHKFALQPIKEGALLIKYGAPIEKFKVDVKVGEHVHVHNVKTALTASMSTHTTRLLNAPVNTSEDIYFDGYRCPDGKVGTRNEIWVMSTVGCVAHPFVKMAMKADMLLQGCDGVFAYTHPFGCSQTGDDHDNTRQIMSALAQHPNAGAILIVGLGCENNHSKVLLETFRLSVVSASVSSTAKKPLTN